MGEKTERHRRQLTREESEFLNHDEGYVVFPPLEQKGALFHSTDIHYRVLVETGRSGVDANVILCIYGDEGTTTNLALKETKDGRAARFMKDSTLEFDLIAGDVGKVSVRWSRVCVSRPFRNQIRRINIGHDGTDAGHAWFLESIKIEKKNQEYMYVEHEPSL